MSCRAIDLARPAASKSPSTACTMDPFIRMCQEFANERGSRSPASSASRRTTEHHVDERTAFEVLVDTEPPRARQACAFMQSDPSVRASCGTTLVPTATSNLSRSFTWGDDGDAGDAEGRIGADRGSAGAESSLVQIQSPRLC